MPSPRPASNTNPSRAPHNAMQLRAATHADVPVLRALIDDSIRHLSISHYTDEQADAALSVAFFGVDTELLEDQSYFLIEDQGRIAACGGWSRRKKLFGGDGTAGNESGYLDPSRDPAKIRAFFVHPDYARQGLGARLLTHCEAQAQAYGFRAFEMMATLSGEAFYVAHGYQRGDEQEYELPQNLRITGVWMRKTV